MAATVGRHGIGCVWILICFSCSAVSAATTRPPNVVVILADDLGATDLGCFGSTFYETPYLDALAKDGMRFTAAYAACPVCSPTRASMMTGRYPQRMEVTDYINPRGKNQPEQWNRNTRLLPAPYVDHLPLEEQTIAEVLGGAGYATFFAGKWHLGGEGYLPTEQGFEINIGGFHGGSPHSYFSPYRNPQLDDGPHGEHLPLRLARETCDFIAANSERPFFAYLSFYSVHIPLDAPAELIAKYKRKAARLPAVESEFAPEHDSEVRVVQSHATYAAVVETMDRAVGMVLAQLEELSLADDTIVIFTSDNGGLSTKEGSPTSNVPFRAGKGWLYEGGIRVPTIIRWPGVAASGSTCAEPIISNDYFATLADAASIAVEDSQIDGTTLVPLLRGEKLDGERELYWHYPHYGNQGGRPGSAVRDGRWKLIDWHEESSPELYDLAADPDETQDLAEQHPQVVERLTQKLHAWRREVGAKMPTPNPNYRP